MTEKMSPLLPSIFMTKIWRGLFLILLPVFLGQVLFGVFITPTVVFAGPPLPTAWPGMDWAVAVPENLGVDSHQLEHVLVEIQSRRLNVHSVLVLRNGYLIFEHYFGSHAAAQPHVQYSVTKSVISALTGIAIEKGLIPGVETSIEKLLGGTGKSDQDPRKAVLTIENILTMASGLGWQEKQQFLSAFSRSRDPQAYILNLPLTAEPGTAFNYCSGCYHLLSLILEEATPAGLREFAKLELFDPLGVAAPTWETDFQGIPNGGWGLYLTSRDMARLGYLYLQGGKWVDRQIVPEEWVRRSTIPYFPTENPQELQYGYGWWTMPRSPAYLARGLGGQVIFIDPDRQLVVIFTAGMDGDEQLLDLIQNMILPAVEAEAPLPSRPAGSLNQVEEGPISSSSGWEIRIWTYAILGMGIVGLVLWLFAGFRRRRSQPPE